MHNQSGRNEQYARNKQREQDRSRYIRPVTNTPPKVLPPSQSASSSPCPSDSEIHYIRRDEVDQGPAAHVPATYPVWVEVLGIFAGIVLGMVLAYGLRVVGLLP